MPGREFTDLLIHSASVVPPKDGTDSYDHGTHEPEWATASAATGSALVQPRTGGWTRTALWANYPDATHALYVSADDFNFHTYGLETTYRVTWSDKAGHARTAHTLGPAELIEDPSTNKAHHWQVPLREVFLAAAASA